DLLTCIVPWLGAAGKRNRTETRAAPGPTILSQVALEATMSVAIWRQANIRGRHIQDKRYRLQSGGTIAMSTELDHLSRLVAKGKLSRRDFLGRASALGVGALAANTLLARAASAEGPRKGGTLKAGMVGGGATDRLDPGSWTNQVPYTFGRCWGEQLLDIRPDGGIEPKLAEEYDSSPDAKVWTFKIRKGVTF